MIAWLLCLALAPVARPFAEESRLLERRLETLRRILPDAPSPDADVALVRQLAEQAGLGQVAATVRPSDAGAQEDVVVVDLSALGRYLEIDRFFRQVALSHRLIDVERLELASTIHDNVKLACVLRLPYRPRNAPLPSPPEGMRNAARGQPRGAAEAFLRNQALALDKSQRIAKLRRSQRNPRLFLSEIAAVTRDRPVTLSFARLEGSFLIRGLTIGEGPARALETRFEQGFFRVSSFLMARDGACRRFEVQGGSPVVGIQAELPIPAEDPFLQDPAPCRVDRDRGSVSTLKGPSSGKGPLSLRARDMDLADVFRTLHQLTGESYIVDGNVQRRVSVDLQRVTLEQAHKTMEKLDIRITDQGPVKRVSLASVTPGPPPEPLDSRPLASFALKRTSVREILAVMAEADPRLATLGPEGNLGQLSVWAKDVSLFDLRTAILQSVGLTERAEGSQRILERHPDSAELVAPVVGSPETRRLVVRPRDVAAVEFRLAGLASGGAGWMALAYSPRGDLHTYLAGTALSDASVKAIFSTDLQLGMPDGSLRIALPPFK